LNNLSFVKNKVLAPIVFCIILNIYPSYVYAETNYMQLYNSVITGQVEFSRLSSADKRMILLIHQSLSTSDDNLDGYDFSLRDVEKKCEAYKYSDSYGDIECSGSSLRIIEKKCEVYFYDSQNGELECRGSGLRELERKCTVSMYSDNYGDIDC
jgi:hypothetical protein